ncbi:MAG: right-handed parallel beta-helix repeat-containing protein [Pirellulales bacterium]|nr:right-handed parallel beta-helix repeat-containing protein [Pirellulales bacterium]
MRRPWFPPTLILLLALLSCRARAETVVKVADDASLRAALRDAGPGTHIQIAPGRYSPGVWISNLRGTEENPILIGGTEAGPPPLFEGGSEGWHLSDCAFVTLQRMIVSGASGNGVNVDDGGSYETPSHHIVLQWIRVSDTGPQGNHDAVKLSGVDDFVVRHCSFDGWGGQAPDMVGCHRGLIDRCMFRGKEGFSQHTGPQTKGGSSQITVRRCLFLDAAQRGVQMGGSTGLAYFRPKGALHEAKDITVEGCVFVGCQAPLAFVGVDGAVVRYNTFYRPNKWIMRILQETTEEGFVPCRNGRFEHNIVVFRRGDVGVFVNIGPHTRPETFVFSDNLWYCEDRPEASKPELPAAESNGLYGVDPQFSNPRGNIFKPQAASAVGLGAYAWKPPAEEDR